MKKDFRSIAAKTAVISALVAGLSALVIKLKRNNDLLTSYENEEDDEPDFGEIDSLDSVNPDASTREYISINITNKDSQ